MVIKYSKKLSFENKDTLVESIKQGGIFIYPTDTLYGIGANACDENAIKRILKIKKRSNNPFLIIPPSIDWVLDNCDELDSNKKDMLLSSTPGNTSFILKLKNKEAINPYANNGLDTIGIRFPNHWFQDIVSCAGVPFISTSANVSGQPSAKFLDEISSDLIDKCDYLIECTEPSGISSKIYDLSGNEVKIIRG